MQRIANPCTPVRFRVAPPIDLFWSLQIPKKATPAYHLQLLARTKTIVLFRRADSYNF